MRQSQNEYFQAQRKHQNFVMANDPSSQSLQYDSNRTGDGKKKISTRLKNQSIDIHG